MHPFSTSWKHQETLTVFWCFQEVEKESLGANGLSNLIALTSWDTWQYVYWTCLNKLLFSFYPGCDVIDFEISLSFYIKPFSYMTKKI